MRERKKCARYVHWTIMKFNIYKSSSCKNPANESSWIKEILFPSKSLHRKKWNGKKKKKSQTVKQTGSRKTIDLYFVQIEQNQMDKCDSFVFM